MFIVYNLISFDMCIHCETISTFQIMNMGITCNSLFIPFYNLSFLFPSLPTPHLQATTDLLSVIIDGIF